VRDTVFLIRFFLAVPPVPGLMMMAFAAAVVSGGVALALRATDPYGALAPIFLVQTLAAASGFAVPARRGHYDLLLTSGVTRLQIGIAHLLASTLPGALCWMIVVCLEALTGGGIARVSLASGTIAALVILSALSWAATVPLPRLTGGIVWLLMSVAPVNHEVLPAPARAVVLPWTLVGTNVLSSGTVVLAVPAAVVCAALLLALGWICRTDISLQVAR
jgi:hypothetical protein